MYDHWRKILKTLAAASLAILMAAPALAQNARNDNDITRGELLNLDRFLDTHSQIESDLRANPSLINDRAYISSHPELQQFLRTHPGVAEEARENPNRLVRREAAFDKSGRDITRGEVGRFDEFLDHHRQVDRDLRKNPNLINDPNYLAKHPGLQQWMQSHPAAAREMRENPKSFMRDERKWEKAERKHHRREARYERQNHWR